MKIIIFSFNIFLSINLISQLNFGGIPYSLRNKVPLTQVPVYKTEQIENSLLKEEEQIDSKFNLSSKFGKSFKVGLSTQNIGEWINLENKDRIWRLRISSSNSIAISFIFNKYNLTNGSRLYIYRPDGSQVLGAFTDINNKGDYNNPGYFGTGLLFSSEAIMELYQPKENIDKDVLEINQIVCAYKNLTFPSKFENEKKLKGFGQSQSCQINVNCFDVTAKSEARDAVAMVIAGGRQYSGALINNTAGDGKLYFLTANHIYSQINTQDHPPSTWTFIWGYESETCTNPPSDPGYNNKVTSGAILRARNSATDFALLELIESPLNLNPPHNAFFCGWKRMPDITGQWGYGFNIYHPKGDIKKIAYYTGPLIPEEFKCVHESSQTLKDPANAYEVKFYEENGMWSTPEQGASGSPLCERDDAKNESYIIAQLVGINHIDCDWVRCHPENRGNVRVVYGRLSKSWNSGSNSSERLKDWLDPLGINPSYLTGGRRNCQAFMNIQVDPWLSTSRPIEAETIEISTNLNLTSSKNRVMQATNFIKHKNGFYVKSSSNGSYKAHIAQCIPRVIPKMALVYNSNQPATKSQPKFNLYPNPGHGIIYFEFENIQKGETVLILRDIQGKIIANQSQKIEADGKYKTEFDTSGLNKGIYLVTFINNTYRETLKLHIE